MNFSDYKKSRLGGKYVRRVKLPNTEIHVGLTILTTQGLLEAESAKNEYLKISKLETNSNAENLENNCQVIYRSAVNPDNESEKLFESVSQVRDMIGEDVNWLAQEYIKLTDDVNPSNVNLTAEDIEDIKKKLSNGEIPTSLSYMQLLQVLMVLGEFKSTTITVPGPSSDAPLST